ncbi:MAG: thioredoxin-related protein [Rhodothermales bacterium]|jgi:thioredoxin-related protein
MLIRSLLAALAITACNSFAAAGWTSDFGAAQKQAREEGKSLLIDFTGSDWCGYCIKLHESVFGKEDFLKAASKDFILVEIDSPRHKTLSPTIKEQNDKLVQEFGVQGYPTVILTSADGYPYAQTGYQPGGPSEYLKHLEGFAEDRNAQKALLEGAEKLSGVEKAKAYDEIISWMGERNLKGGYDPLVEAIKELDPTDSSKLRSKYENAATLRAIEGAVNSTGDLDRALKDLKLLLAKGPAAGVAQQAYLLRAMIQMRGKNDTEAGMKSLRAAVAIDPDSQVGQQIRGFLDQQPKEPAADQ